MSRLLTRKPRKEISVATAADMLACGRDTVKRIAKREGWRTRRNGLGPTSKMLVFEADVIEYKTRMAKLADA
jgi:hypothetical protein